MADRDVIVSGIERIEPAVDRHMFLKHGAAADRYSVVFDDTQTAFLDSKHPAFALYAEVLADLHEVTAGVYVEVDKVSRAIEELLAPSYGTVATVSRSSAGDVTFRLDRGAQVFSISAGHPSYEGWLDLLVECYLDAAPVVVTEAASEEAILDIRRAPQVQSAKPESTGAEPHPFAMAVRPVSEDEARRLFALVARPTCDPRRPEPGCIPYLYVRDGCHARAHEMCRLMFEAGAHPSKVWNFSDLMVIRTENEPSCEATWGVHVAPTLQVESADGQSVRTLVIDPALFGEPVPVQVWQAAQGDKNSILSFTSAAPYVPPLPGDVETDDDFLQTARDLVIYRSKLRIRSQHHGAPPYLKCRAQPA
jgi:hypothetical protein